MKSAVITKRAHWTAIIVCSCSIFCTALVDESTAFQLDTAELRLISLPAPSVVDQAAVLPTSQTVYITGDTFYVELWAQTDAPAGLAQASADLAFNSSVVTGVSITHTAAFSLFPAGTIDNLAGTVDNLSGSHSPASPPCSDQVGAAPLWARVAVVEMRARTAAITPITLADSNDLFFVVAVCNSLATVPATYVGVTVDVRAPLATIGLVALPAASGSDLAVALPASQAGFPVGSPFVLEMWAQTDSNNGLAQVSADVAFDPTLVSAGTVTHSALFNLFTTGSVNNFIGTIDNLSGAHPPVIPSCSDSVGTSPNWARVATVSMTADAVGSLTIQSADANDLIFVMAVCGSEISPVTSFGGVPVAVTLCGNGMLEPGEDCDDGNVAAGDCCSPTCTFEAITTVCRGAVDGCDVAEFCDGAGACPVDGFQAVGTACGNPANSACDAADTCDGSGLCLANIAPITTECRAIASDCDVAEFCDGVGACPVDDFQLAGTACGDPTTGACDNPDTCDGGGTCSPNFAVVTVLCRSAADECDVDDFCDGAGACDVNAFQAAGTACGDPAITTCDNPDSCDGAGVCVENLEPVTTVCRSPISDCDIPEFCDGLGRCPLDGFLALGSACGDPSTTVCDNPDTCDATGSCLTNPGASTILCRVAASPCDVDELCDGMGSCPADSFQPAGTTCGDPTVTVCDAADTCDGAGACADNFEPVATECRASIGDCDFAEFCDGAGACPTDAFELVGVACGDPTATICDNPDSCDGVGGCLVNLEPTTTECRGALGECDVAELCDGLGFCPADTVVNAGVACGDPTSSVCDNADTCDGAGLCQANALPSTTSCRTSLGECDIEEFCDGAGLCPGDQFVVAGAACGDPADTVCDGADTCDGGGSCLMNIEPSTTSCRTSLGECDIEEFCDGAGLCPGDLFIVAGAACGDPGVSICDNADTCDGGGACLGNPISSTTECRASIGECDTAELCDGAGSCPPDAFLVAGATCGDPTMTVCDDADTCDGAGSCLQNLEPVTTTCRATGGECDFTEFCDGLGACPPDAKSVAECRVSAGECDVAEFCDGVTNTCPVDSFQITGTACGDPADSVCDGADTCDGGGSCLMNIEPATTSCRASLGECDIEEFCDGAGLCPGDQFIMAGAACGDPAVSICDNADTCDGAGACLGNPVSSTTECRASIGECDTAELCDGAGSCPADVFPAAGAICGDPTITVCDDADTCDGAGTCLQNFLPNGTSCNDPLFCNGDEFCQAGVCDPGPPFCVDVCEHCTEAAGACEWCIFDHNLTGTMDGFDFSFFSGCFGGCFVEADACFVANYDLSPDGCVGGGDFGAFSGCFSLTCGMCPSCSGPGIVGGVATATLTASAASVQLVAVDLPRTSDVSAVLPVSRGALSTNETFSVEVWATRSGNQYDGLGSVYVDIAYDSSLLEVVEIISSDSFSLFSNGSIDASAGLITAIGGCAPVGDGTMGTQSDWVRVATLRMRALATGATSMAIEPSYGPFGVSVFGRFGDLPSRQIEFGATELRIQRRGATLPKGKDRQRSSRN